MPFETPIVSAIGVRRDVQNTLFEWQTEDLPASDTTADVEGAELERADSTPTVRESNVVQIKHRDATVSGTQQKVNNAGKRNELNHQLALCGKALKRDIEIVVTGTTQTRVLGNGSTARTTRAVTNFLESNTDNGAGGADPVVSTNTAVTDGTQRAFTETIFNDVLQSAWENGGMPSNVYVGGFNKRTMSGFEGRSNSRHAVAAGAVVNSVSVYDSDFGDLRIYPSRNMRARDCLILDPEYIKMAYLRPFEREVMAKIGDADTEAIYVEFGLQVDNEAAHGIVRDLTTS